MNKSTGNKTMINGAVYQVKNGKVIVNGTIYTIAAGKTIIDGVIRTLNVSVENIDKGEDMTSEGEQYDLCKN